MLCYFALTWVLPFTVAFGFVGYIVWHNRPLMREEDGQ